MKAIRPLLIVVAISFAACSDDVARITFAEPTAAAADTAATTRSTHAPSTDAETATSDPGTPTTTTAATTTSTPQPPTTLPPVALDEGWYNVLVFDVDPAAESLEVDLIEWIWTGPADTEGYWTNTDPAHLQLPTSVAVTVLACPEDMTGEFPPMLYCQPDEQVTHTLQRFSEWITAGTIIGQNDRFEIPGGNGQHWLLVVENDEVTEISGIWWP